MRTNKQSRNAADRKMIDGITKHLGKGASITFDGKKYSAAEIVKLLSGRIAARAGVESAKALLAKAVAAQNEQSQETTPVVSGLRQVCALLYKSQPEVLADLGIATRKSRPAMTVEEKAATVAKGRATRKARGTLGPRQRAKIHGTTVDHASPAVAHPAMVSNGQNA